MTNSPYSGAGWVFRPGFQRGFREVAMLPDAISFGFCDLGDLGALPPRRIAFRRTVTEAYPDLLPSRYPQLISQFHWFAVTMQPGDLVALIDERRGFLFLGRISGEYAYAPVDGQNLNRRPVAWISIVPLMHVPKECSRHWRARTGLFPMGKAFESFSALEGDSLIKLDESQAG